MLIWYRKNAHYFVSFLSEHRVDIGTELRLSDER